MLAFGTFRRSERTSLQVAASESAYQLTVRDSVEQALEWLSKTTPGCMVLDIQARGAQEFALEARLSGIHTRVPMIALSRAVDDLAFADVFSQGSDDLVRRGDTRALVARLRSLPREFPQEALENRGTVVVADSERSRRIVLGRVLRNAGYQVSFATSMADVLAAAKNGPIELVIASAEIDDWASAIAGGQGAGTLAARWIVTAAPREMSSLRTRLTGLDVTVADGYAPAENMLFIANEIGSRTRENQRKSQRLLYGTTVLFRDAGRDKDDFGCTYNVSESGLYVRTLMPPEDDSVWLELTPPRSERRVRLVGRVVWRRRFGPNDRATVPAGFGVQITDGTSADLNAWRAGYRAFLSDVG